MTNNEVVGWRHQLNGYEFEQAPGVGEGQGSLACCSPWGREESDTTEQLNRVKCLHSVVQTWLPSSSGTLPSRLVETLSWLRSPSLGTRELSPQHCL